MCLQGTGEMQKYGFGYGLGNRSFCLSLPHSQPLFLWFTPKTICGPG